jgi:protein-S-isoprenylcysteine O-methyltransferase Ste14
LAANNWILLVVVALVCSLAYGFRMQSEEAKLIMKFGKDYGIYI